MGLKFPGHYSLFAGLRIEGGVHDAWLSVQCSGTCVHSFIAQLMEDACAVADASSLS